MRPRSLDQARQGFGVHDPVEPLRQVLAHQSACGGTQDGCRRCDWQT